MLIANTYHLTIPSQTSSSLFACLTENERNRGFYTVYIGIVDLPNGSINDESYRMAREKAAEWVMAHGEKLIHSKAKAYFDIPEDRYVY